MGLAAAFVAGFVGALLDGFVLAIAVGFAGLVLMVRLRRGREMDFACVVDGWGSVTSRRWIVLASADFGEGELTATFVEFAFCDSEDVFFGCGLFLAVSCDEAVVSVLGFSAGELVSLFETFNPDFGWASSFERLNLDSVKLCFGMVSAGFRSRF